MASVAVKNVKGAARQICAKCCKAITSKDPMLQCSICTMRFDLLCIALTKKSYESMTTESKKNWVCKTCLETKIMPKRRDNISKNNGTPSKSTIIEQKKNININNECRKNTTTQSKRNNIPRAQPTLTRSCSLESLNTTLNTTSCSDIRARSYDLSTHVSPEELLELKDEISDLKTQLASTQDEMDNTILENIDLKRTITTLERQIATLKDICQTPKSTSKSSLSTCKKKSNPRKSFGTPTVPHDNKTRQPMSSSPIAVLFDTSMPLSDKQPTSTPDAPIGHLEAATKSSADKVTTRPQCDQECLSPTDGASCLADSLKLDTKPKLLIYGTQQSTGLGAIMSEYRRNYCNKYEHYDIFASNKPFATSEDVLRGFIVREARSSLGILAERDAHQCITYAAE